MLKIEAELALFASLPPGPAENLHLRLHCLHYPLDYHISVPSIAGSGGQEVRRSGKPLVGVLLWFGWESPGGAPVACRVWAPDTAEGVERVKVSHSALRRAAGNRCVCGSSCGSGRKHRLWWRRVGVGAPDRRSWVGPGSAGWAIPQRWRHLGDHGNNMETCLEITLDMLVLFKFF